MKGDHAAGSDGDFFTGLGISTGPLRLVAQVEIAEARQLHAIALLQCRTHFFEERFDHVFRLALVQTDAFEEHFGEFSLRERLALIGAVL